jgi:hypothetical protein
MGDLIEGLPEEYFKDINKKFNDFQEVKNNKLLVT